MHSTLLAVRAILVYNSSGEPVAQPTLERMSGALAAQGADQEGTRTLMRPGTLRAMRQSVDIADSVSGGSRPGAREAPW